jgi:predicted porin
MKKTLVAVAALVAATGSFAQSSVTLYGVVDASLENVKGTKSLTRVSSDNLASSRLGFKGVEDLGGGLKANFVLETAVSVDTGASGSDTTRFFGRAAWVGLQSAYGDLRIGRQDSSIGALAGNTAILGGQAYDDFNIAGTFSGKTYRRLDNAITYVAPTFVPGLSTQVQYSTQVSGAEATDGSGKAYGLSAQYAAGPFGAGLGYINAKKSSSVKDSALLAFGSYDFGMAKVVAYYEQDKTSKTVETTKLYGAKVVVPVATGFSVQAGLSKAKNTDKLAKGDDDNATILAVKAVYDLSKRTSVYGLFTNVDNAKGSTLGLTTTAAGKDSRGLAFGVKHAF